MANEKTSDLLRTIVARLDTMDRRLERLDDQFNRIERNVKAIGSFPVPYRPKTYHTATELHSVSRPTKRRLGHMG